MNQLIDSLERIVSLKPSQIAIVSLREEVSYQQLWQESEELLVLLKAGGVHKGEIVAINVDDRYRAIVSIVALYRMGCGYLPLDPVYPVERLNYMLKNSGVRCLVADNSRLAAADVSTFDLDSSVWSGTGRITTADVVDNPGYIIYTSGSTGQPKGVNLSMSVLESLLSWQNTRYGQSPAPVTAQFSALSFDVSFQEIFSTLLIGGTLILVPDDVKRDFSQLVDFIAENKIQRIFMPYIALLNLTQWAVRLNKYPTQLKEVITAGEQLLTNHEIKTFFRHCSSARLINQYGPSESHVVSEFILPANVEEWPKIPPIGRPVSAAEFYVVDDRMLEVDAGEVGELLISGPVLATSYINNPTETEARFIHLELNGQKRRCYRTGDLVSQDAQGQFHYKGRTDSQVKINGYRIELTEVESALMELDSVHEAAVNVIGEKTDDRKLIAFVTTQNSSSSLPKDIRKMLSDSIPGYMIPSHIMVVDALLRTPSGKIDRKTMTHQWMRERDSLSRHDENPADMLFDIIKKSLMNPDVSIADNLIDLGMDSIMANQLSATCLDQLGIVVPAYQFFQYKNIDALLKFVNRKQASLPIGKKEAIAGAENHSRDIAIIGMAVDVPGAESVNEFWEVIKTGGETIHFFNEHNKDGLVNARGILKEPTGFDASFFRVTPGEAEMIDPQQRKLLELSWHGLEDSGYTPENFHGRIGVYCGTGNNTYYLNNVLKNQEKYEEFGALQSMIANEKDYCATRIAHKLNLTGPAVNIQSACSTSLVSVCHAVNALRNNECDMAIAGGASITFPQQQPYRYEEGAIFSKDGHTRTFDAESNGTVFSDGAGVVVLKRLDNAIDDGDHIFAVIKGVALNNDGGEKGSFSAPSVEGQKRVILSAQQDAGIAPRDIGYLEAHGTATPIGDPIEVAALTEAFRTGTNDSGFCYLGSVKSNLGHLTAAAGVAGLVKTVMSIRSDVIPPAVNFSRPNPGLALDRTPFSIPLSAQTWQRSIQKRYAGISSFGIGGTNAHVIVSGYDDRSGHSVDQASTVFPLCVSAHSEQALQDYIAKYQHLFKTNQQLDLADVTASALFHREPMRWRTSFYADSVPGLLRSIQDTRKVLRNKTIDRPNIVMMFSGQGTQISGMGKELYQYAQAFRTAVDECAEIAHRSGVALKELIFDNHDDLTKTANTQIALFTICYALYRQLCQLGVQPTHLLGHSIGELVAATVSGVFDLETAVKVVLTRGRVMQTQPSGAMAAVRANPSDVAPLLPDDVVIAADNAPDSCTISGPSAQINAAIQALQAKKIGVKPLVTSHAFHSPMMDTAAEEFAQALESVSLHTPRVPFISCVTGDWIRDDQAVDIHYWAQQIREPVQFRSGCGKVTELGSYIAIEVGPQQVLSGLLNMTQITLNEDDAVPTGGVQLLPEPAKAGEYERFMSALGRLWQYGVNVDFGQLGTVGRYTPELPKYPFQHKTFEIQPDSSLHAQMPMPAVNPVAINNTAQGVVSVNSAILKQLKDLFSEASGMDLESASSTESFFELGFDSLFLTQSIAKIKKKFKVSITFRQLMNDCNNLQSLADYLEKEGAAVDMAVSQPVPKPVDLPSATMNSVPAEVSNVHLSQAGDNSLVALFSQQLQLINNQMAMLNSGMLQGQIGTAAQTTQPAADEPKPVTLEKATKKIKPFGAGVRINVKRTNDLTPEQQKNLDTLSARYINKFSASKAFAQKNRPHLADPRVVSGFRPTLKEIIFPIVVEKSQGAYLWDIDGNQFIDVTCGFGSNFFGNSAPFIKDAISAQLEKGYEIGPQHPLVAQVAEKFCALTDSQRVAFCNTGSEAVLGAVRLARTVTAKDHVVMFENDYHGINDEVIVHRGGDGHASPAAAGIPETAVERTMMLDYGSDESLAYIEAHADEIAAVLVEPVQSRNPELQPKAFLQALRTLCDKLDIALIFDEVITGFRIHQKGAQGYFGIQSDLATYGKVIGGGLPIGVIAGKAKFMDALDGGQWSFGDDSAPEVGVTYFAGTFVRHPLALAAANAVLDKLTANPGLQEELNGKTKAMVDEINRYIDSVAAPMRMVRCGSLFRLDIPQDIGYEELIYILLREKGIHVWDARPCFLTLAHSQSDIDRVVSAYKQSIDEMLALRFFEPTRKIPAKSSLPTEPPIPGARLGKDPEGNPAWYIEDPDNQGKYLMLEV